MNNPPESLNRRILVIDDNQSIHQDFAKILLPPPDNAGSFDEMRKDLLGDVEAGQRLPPFTVESALQGQEGLDRVKQAMDIGRPFALAFVDMRMPPGWDGIETIARLWEAAPDLQVVLCTAYSDYSWEELVARLGQSDRLVILKKPFDPIEVLQLASSLTEKWRLLQQSKLRIEDLERMVAARTEELQRSEEHLRQSQKMEAIGQLAGGIAHDFNNILGCILGYAELTLQEVPDNAPVQENLRGVIQAGLRARDLVEQILTFSRQQEQDRKPVQLQEVIAEALKLLRASLPATIEIAAEIDEQAPAVLADASQMHQVLMNLATNAAQAMNGAGRLEIQLRAHATVEEFGAARLELPPHRYIQLRVRDTGCGMEEATLERIFEPFFTTKAPGQGTGLGLSVVHGIVTSHRGAIHVDSQPGLGTTFDLFLPAQDVQAPELEAPQDSVPLGHGERVLFVDDEAPLAFLGKELLERAGYRVIPKTDPLEALAAFRAEPEGYDLVVTDLTMPNLTGTDLARDLLQLRADLPIVLATGFAGLMTAATAQALGIRELLLKPTSFRSLAESAHRVLAQEKEVGR